MADKIKFKRGKITTSDFWYDLTDGGYIKPSEIVLDPVLGKDLDEAVAKLRNFYNQLENQNKINHL